MRTTGQTKARVAGRGFQRGVVRPMSVAIIALLLMHGVAACQTDVAAVQGPVAATAATTVPTAEWALLTPPRYVRRSLANECASPKAGWIWCDDFDVDRLASYFEVDNAGGHFTRVAGVGTDGSTGMRGQFLARASNAGALHLAIGRTPQKYMRPADAGTATYRELYWRVYVRNQPGWTGGGGDKLMRAFVFASPTTFAQAMISHVWASGQNYLALDPARGTDAAGTLLTTTYNDFARLTWLGLVRGNTPIFDAAHVGAWHCVEAHVLLNDAGASNGVNELWIDSSLEARKTGVNWLGAFSAYGLNAVYLENFWNAGSPVAQERYFDNFVVSTQRIGC